MTLKHLFVFQDLTVLDRIEASADTHNKIDSIELLICY